METLVFVFTLSPTVSPRLIDATKISCPETVVSNTFPIEDVCCGEGTEITASSSASNTSTLALKS